MNDLISRQAAIKLILSGKVGYNSLVECPEECNSMLEWAADEVAKMPNAEKVGKWINDRGLYRCSVCNELWCDWWASCVSIERMNKVMPYCPKCGARMRGEEDEF